MGSVTGDKPDNPVVLELQNLTANGVLLKPNLTTKKSSLSIMEIFQTARFVQHSQSRQPPGDVRFVVQPVPDDEIPGIHSSVPYSLHTNSGLGEGLTHDVYGLNAGYAGSSDPQAQLTVRSMDSIGLGSSNGRKIYSRRLHSTGTEALVSPIVTSNNPCAVDAVALLQNSNNGDTVHSHWHFPPLIKVNDKTAEQHHHGGERVLGSSRSSSSSSSSVGDVDGRKKKKKKGPDGQRKTHCQNGQVWCSRLEFILACASLAAGLGNIWRFPYIAFKSGEGAFLILYSTMVFLCGIPLQTLELAVRQYTREEAAEAMRSIYPLFSGVGVGMVIIISLILSTYYSVAMAWSGLYLGLSFTTQLPWTHYDNSWNTEACLPVVPESVKHVNDEYSSKHLHNPGNETDPSSLAFTAHNWTTPGQEFFDRRIKKNSDGANVLEEVQWELTVGLLIAWALLFVTLRSVRWPVNVIATLPYVLLITMTARALTLTGADGGLFHPDWSLLLKADVWVNDLAQTFMSMGIAYGCLMAFASNNRFHSAFVRGALCVLALNSLTSLAVGIIVFAAIGHTAHLYDVPLQSAVAEGLGFSLVMYSTIVLAFMLPQFWAVFFFVCPELDTQFATVEFVWSTIIRFTKQVLGSHTAQNSTKGGDNKMSSKSSRCLPDLVAVFICLFCLLGVIPYVTQGRIYLLHMTGYFVGTAATILLALIVSISNGILYGAGRLSRNIWEMTAHSLSPLLVMCWAAVTPLLISGIWIFDSIDIGSTNYDHSRYIYLVWVIVLGWALLCLILITFPIFAILDIYQASGKTFLLKLTNLAKSQMSECPCCRRGVRGLRYTHSAPKLNEDGPDSTYAFAEFADNTYPDDGTVTITSASSFIRRFAAQAICYPDCIICSLDHYSRTKYTPDRKCVNHHRFEKIAH